MSFFASFKPGIPQERYLEPEEDMVLFVPILHTNAFSNKFVCNVLRTKIETFLTKCRPVWVKSSYTVNKHILYKFSVIRLIARINSGNFQDRDRCYEFIGGLLSRNTICVNFQEKLSNLRTPQVIKTYDSKFMEKLTTSNKIMSMLTYFHPWQSAYIWRNF